ncbi:MAG: sulfatase [Candidatus Hydrogenedentes bacterium]|nr:sulfatase [Candidatus Hydrogenedentota bacterium]
MAHSVVAALLCAVAGLPTAPNVVLLSVDTLRADRLGCYGYDPPTSPHLDAFAQEARLFENVVCEVPLTAPSFASMLSSRYPRMTGLTRNGLRMPGGVPLVQEEFQKAGYQTFCIQSNWTLKRKLSALDRGFDHYDDAFHNKRWGIIKPERDAEEVTRLTVALLNSRDASKPFFAWIHFSDPHAPYKLHRTHNPQDKRTGRLDKVEKVGVKYDSEVAYTDAHIRQVLEALPEGTAVLFVADHGESLWEHDYLGHGRRIYQDGLHVPLMIRAPGVAPGRTAVPARGLDIAPTLLGLAGLTPPPTMLGVDLLRQPPPSDRVRIVETYGGAVPKLPGAKAIMGDAKPMRQGVLAGPWKLVLGSGRPELYRLDQDPWEVDNRASAEPDHVARLKEMISSWDTATAHAQEEGAALSDADIEALRSLGYVE